MDILHSTRGPKNRKHQQQPAQSHYDYAFVLLLLDRAGMLAFPRAPATAAAAVHELLAAVAVMHPLTAGPMTQTRLGYAIEESSACKV